DVLGMFVPYGGPSVVVAASSLDLGAGDVVDALAYDTVTHQVVFSLAPGSPTLAAIGARPADLLAAPGPTLMISAAALGLLPTDDVDALDIPRDGDQDLVADGCDNCPTLSNNDQADFDRDGIGDVCDPCPRVNGFDGPITHAKKAVLTYH